jgi:shikimate kinase
MGTGKTSVARALSDKCGYNFIDLDEAIVNIADMTIPEIFSKLGESEFRKLEKTVLLDVSAKKHMAVSCGGGIMLSAENIAVMKSSGIMIRLNASATTLYKRLDGCRNRPLLMSGASPQENINRLIAEREIYYSKADYTIITDDLSIDEVACEVIKIINGK